MARLGPGLVFALSVIGPGSFITNAAAGATQGYALLWLLGLTVFMRYIWLDTSGRYVLVTGETLMAGYARVGDWLVRLLLIALVFTGHLYVLYKVVLLGFSIHILLPLPSPYSLEIWSLFFVLSGFGMMYWGGYPAVETICKILTAVMGASLILAAVLSKPAPLEILKGTFIPSFPESTGFYSTLLIITALIGTEAGSITNITYAYFLHEKGWRDLSYLKRQRFDLALSAGTIFLMAALLQIAAAGTLHASGATLDDAEDLIQIFTEYLGLPGRVIFALGLWGAVFSSFVGTTLGKAVTLTDICRQSITRFKKPGFSKLDEKQVRRDPIYRTIVFFWSFSPLYVLFVDWEPVGLALVVSAAVVLLIPILGLGLLRITNAPDLMGDYKNGWFRNAILIFLILVSLYLVYQNGVTWWEQLV